LDYYLLVMGDTHPTICNMLRGEKMNKRYLFVLLTLIVAASMVLSACGAPAATEAPVEEPAATEAPPKNPPPLKSRLLNLAHLNTRSRCSSFLPWM
jgi:hypothetical protein